MATSAPTRVTDLARDYRLDIDLGTSPTVNYQQLPGIKAAKFVETRRTTDDEVYEAGGAMAEELTGYDWQVELTIGFSSNPAGTSRNAVHAFLRDKFLAGRSQRAGAATFGVRWYKQTGLDDADEGRVWVKSWDTTDDKSKTDDIKIVLRGHGPVASIANPLANLTPVIESLSATGGGTAGGELVHIYGYNFTGVTGATGVQFGATNATAYTLIDDGHIVAIAPAHTAGSVQVKVTTPAGASANTAADDYLYA